MPETTENSHCVRCGKPFACGMAAGEAKCWCSELPPVKPVAGQGCLCRACLEAKIRESALQNVAR